MMTVTSASSSELQDMGFGEFDDPEYSESMTDKTRWQLHVVHLPNLGVIVDQHSTDWRRNNDTIALQVLIMPVWRSRYSV